jgi:hypothetical protein
VTAIGEVWRLPHSSQECEHGPEARLTERTLTIRYDFETDAGAYEWASLQFEEVIALEFLREELCGPDQLSALDKLLEVLDSPWLRKVHAGRRLDSDPVHHYRIYFDDYGCYEILSGTFSPGT